MTGSAEATSKDVPTVISSLLVKSVPEKLNRALREIAEIAGVEIHEVHGSTVVVSIEAESVKASYARARALAAVQAVDSVQLVYANFEDDPVVQRQFRKQSHEGSDAISPVIPALCRNPSGRDSEQSHEGSGAISPVIPALCRNPSGRDSEQSHEGSGAM
jgi:nitrate reductase NapD